MGRVARVVVPGIPHHVTQRGNRKQRTFFSDRDYHLYIRLMAENCVRAGVGVWAYCLMPNHIHLIAVPSSEDGLRCAVGEAHRRYTVTVNSREGWTGYLWQGRFSSYPMDERHLVAATRYIELNPVRAGLVQSPGDWPWSSVRAHMLGKDDGLVQVEPLLRIVDDWVQFLEEDIKEVEALRKHRNTGRPLGDELFIEHCEQISGRTLRRHKPGPKGPIEIEP